MGIPDHLTCLLRKLYSGQEETELDVDQWTCSKLKSVLITQSCQTLCDPMDWHIEEPTRLIHPWNSPGKNTGVGCHFLLQGNLPDPGVEPGSSTLWADTFLTEPPANKLEKEYIKAIYCYRSLFNLYAEYIMKNAGLQR